MDIANILEIGNYTDILSIIEEENSIDGLGAQELQDIYAGEHAILSREDKKKTNKDGAVIGDIPTAKIVLNYQKKIVNYAVNFLFGQPVTVSKSTEGGEDSFQILKDNLENIYWNDSNRLLSRKLFTQKKAAKLFFIKNPADAEKRKLSYMLLSVENGTFYPNFADNGDMDGFLRKYTKKQIVNKKVEEVEAFELYTDTQIIYGTLTGGAWQTQIIANPYGKIPVVYYEREQAEWQPAQTIIDRQELSISQQVDTNEYNSAPITVIKGDPLSMPEKGAQGKSIKMSPVEDADGKKQFGSIEYLTWNQMIDAIKLQMENFEKWIFAMTNTADLSFNSLLNAKPSNMTNSGWKTLLLDSFLEAKNKQELFMPNLHREINVIKSILGVLDTGLQSDFAEMRELIEFGSVLPSDSTEIIAGLVEATGDKQIMSQETAVRNNPYVNNAEIELEKIQSEEGIEAGTFNL